MLNFETIQDWYNRGWMTEDDVNQFLAFGAITEEQANTILEEEGKS
ncbi:XkdX family protein [Enterococcus casseliflavus]|nr:XkdX family protein [Enterococcus casseliflavus]